MIRCKRAGCRDVVCELRRRFMRRLRPTNNRVSSRPRVPTPIRRSLASMPSGWIAPKERRGKLDSESSRGPDKGGRSRCLVITKSPRTRHRQQGHVGWNLLGLRCVAMADRTSGHHRSSRWCARPLLGQVHRRLGCRISRHRIPDRTKSNVSDSREV